MGKVTADPAVLGMTSALCFKRLRRERRPWEGWLDGGMEFVLMPSRELQESRRVEAALRPVALAMGCNQTSSYRTMLQGNDAGS